MQCCFFTLTGFSCSLSAILSQLFSLSCSLSAVLSQLFSLSCSLSAVLSQLFSLSCSLSAVLSQLFSLSCSLLAVLSQLFSLSCSLSAVLSQLFSLSCSLSAVLSQLFSLSVHRTDSERFHEPRSCMELHKFVSHSGQSFCQLVGCHLLSISQSVCPFTEVTWSGGAGPVDPLVSWSHLVVWPTSLLGNFWSSALSGGQFQ